MQSPCTHLQNTFCLDFFFIQMATILESWHMACITCNLLELGIQNVFEMWPKYISQNCHSTATDKHYYLVNYVWLWITNYYLTLMRPKKSIELFIEAIHHYHYIVLYIFHHNKNHVTIYTTAYLCTSIVHDRISV